MLFKKNEEKELPVQRFIPLPEILATKSLEENKPEIIKVSQPVVASKAEKEDEKIIGKDINELLEFINSDLPLQNKEDPTGAKKKKKNKISKFDEAVKKAVDEVLRLQASK